MDEPRIFSTQGVVLLLVMVRPGITVKEIADALSLTYRTVWGLVGELRNASLINVRKEGRRHHYFVNVDAPFPHPLLAHRTLGYTVRAIIGSPEALRSRGEESAEDKPHRVTTGDVVDAIRP